MSQTKEGTVYKFPKIWLDFETLQIEHKFENYELLSNTLAKPTIERFRSYPFK